LDEVLVRRYFDRSEIDESSSRIHSASQSWTFQPSTGARTTVGGTSHSLRARSRPTKVPKMKTRSRTCGVPPSEGGRKCGENTDGVDETR